MSLPRFAINIDDTGRWARVYLSEGEPTGEVAQYLSRTLEKWMKDHPELRVRQIVPICSNGDTSELHVWYDRIDTTLN